MFNEYPDIVSVETLCKMLHIGKSSVYTLLKGNAIKHVKVGRKHIIPKGSVIEFLTPTCYNSQRVIDGRLQEVTKGEIAQ